MLAPAYFNVQLFIMTRLLDLTLPTFHSLRQKQPMPFVKFDPGVCWNGHVSASACSSSSPSLHFHFNSLLLSPYLLLLGECVF